MEFFYRKTVSQNLGPISRPVIPVTLAGPRRSAQVSMLLDSGADITLLPYSIGKAIGLEADMSRRKEVHGIGEGGIAYILSEVGIRIGGAEEISVRLGWALIEEVPAILGRLDVFRRFSIEFREFEDKIVLHQAGSQEH